MEKLIITAAITGAATIPSLTPFLPITPEQIADSAIEASKAGASIVHIHARNPEDGYPSANVEHYQEILTRIKEKSDVIVCITTGGSVLMTIEERTNAVSVFKPEMCSFNLGSINFALHTSLSSIKKFKFSWEKDYLEKSKDFIFKNTFKDFEYLVDIIDTYKVKPELEIYDIGHLYNLDYLINNDFLSPPFHLQFVMGVLGAIRGTPEDLILLKTKADTLFGKDNFTWSVVGVGSSEINLSTMAIHMGGHVRVGLEDNIYIKKGVLAKSNADLVKKIVDLAELLNRKIASPDDTRKILSLKGISKVEF